MKKDEIRIHNRQAWNRFVVGGNRWTKPVSAAEMQLAATGDFQVVLTPSKPVPKHWFPALRSTKTLCLAAAGGQQAPVLAAAGAMVTVFDNSPKQLEQDRSVAVRSGLTMAYVEGDMADLSMFADASFEFIFHPCSNTFVPDVRPVWRECFRVLQQGGVMMAGFTNAVRYIFDDERKENGNLEVLYSLPYADTDHLNEDHIAQAIKAGKPLEFGHTLEAQIGGQLEAGFTINGFYEDRFPVADGDPLSRFLDTYIATRATKPL